MGKLVILVMPGSRAAVELAMRKIILPELPHIVHEVARDDGRFTPPSSATVFEHTAPRHASLSAS